MRVLILANFGMGLYKFRRELVEELIKRNHEVFVSVPNDDYVPRLEKLGCRYVRTELDRRGTNPIADLKLLLSYIKTIKRIKPDVVLTYTIKPNVYGGIACRFTNTPYVANVTGLGTSIETKGLTQKIALFLYRIGLKEACCVFFQNESNRQFFCQNRIVEVRTRTIPGSGVNLHDHPFEEYPSERDGIRFLFIGRIMRAKGIDDLLEAATRVVKEYPVVSFDLVGGSEEDYLSQITELEQLGIVKYHGQVDDVHAFIKRSHATILPSYHEGMANVLLESASAGRPVLASRVPGCIETFDEGVSGLGFEPQNVTSLVDAIVRFIKLPYEQKRNMGLAGRKKMEKEFDRNIVVDAYLEEISRVFV